MELSVHESGRSRSTDDTIARAYNFADLSSYSTKDQLLIHAADFAFYSLIKLIGKTIHWEVEGWEHWEAASTDGQAPIYTFWHNHIFVGTYYFRDRGIVVMTSRSFDGEYIARFIQRLGYGAVRGSSTRGAVGALIEMTRLAREGVPTGFSIDGPKGPRHVAKMGAVILARKTGQPILPFTLTCKRFWEAKRSWDRFQVPMPFTRVLLKIAPPIYVSADSDDPLMNRKRDELQATLDELTRNGEEWARRIR